MKTLASIAVLAALASARAFTSIGVTFMWAS